MKYNLTDSVNESTPESAKINIYNEINKNEVTKESIPVSFNSIAKDKQSLN